MSDAPANLSVMPGGGAGRDALRSESGRLAARVRLAAAHAAALGARAVDADLREAMAGIEAAPEALAAGLRVAGLSVREARVAAPEAGLWPALAEMTGGRLVLVLAQANGQVILHEPDAPDGRAEVAEAEFAHHFVGRVLVAEAPAAALDLAPAPKHWFWGEFAGLKRHVAEIALGSFVANLLAVAVALFALQVYDRVIPHQSEATLWVLAGGAALALVFEGALKTARAQILDGAGRQVELNVQRLLMDRILGMRSDLAGKAPSQLFSAMREFGAVREFFTAATIGTLTDLPFVVLFLVLVAGIAGPVVWVLIAGALLMVLPGLLMQRRMMRLTEEMQGAGVRSARLLHEAVFELDTLKTQRAEDRFRRLWAELTALQALKSSEQRRLGSALTSWAQGIQQATYVAAVIAGTYLVFAGQFTVGTLIAVGILSGRTLGPLTQLSGTLARWSNVRSALSGLDRIALAAQDQAEGRSYLRRERLEGGYQLHEVQFSYEEDAAPVLDIAVLAIQPGQRVAVLGTNGSGKSTFLKVLSGLYAPSQGRVLIDGTDMGQVAPRDLRRGIGYLGQDVRLFAGSLRDNLNLTLLERDDGRLMAALDFAGLGPFVRGHAKGLDLEYPS